MAGNYDKYGNYDFSMFERNPSHSIIMREKNSYPARRRRAYGRLRSAAL